MRVNILVKTETLSREEWLQCRKRGIGGSDVSAILGISRWKSAVGLWLEKTGQADDIPKENEDVQWGNIMEPVIRKYFSEVMGRPVIEVRAVLQHSEYPFMLADIDGLTVDDEGNPAVLEVKTASEYKRSEWENDIPVYYQTQVQHYLCVTGAEKAYVAVLIGGNSFRVYEMDADLEVHKMLIAVEREFWYKVQNMVRPEIDGSDASRELLDRIYKGGSSERAVLPGEAIGYIEEYISASDDEEDAKARKQDAANHIKDIMGDFNSAECLGYTVTWKPVKSERVDAKALKAEEPEVYAKYIKTVNSRRFSIK